MNPLQQASQAPLHELLRHVPADARLTINEGEFSTRYIPVGRLCHEAAEALTAQQTVQSDPLWPVDGLYPDMQPPATSRDRWMFDQGRLAERRIAQQVEQGEAVAVVHKGRHVGTSAGVHISRLAALDELPDGVHKLYTTPPAPQQPEALAQQEREDAVLAYLDALGDDAIAHIWPDDLVKCQTSECVVEVASVRMGSPDGKTLPLFSRDQVREAIRAARSSEGGAQ